MVGTRPVNSSGRFGRVSSAAPTMETNISSTIALRTFSNRPYRPTHTRARPTSPERMPHQVTPSTGNNEYSASPVPAIAAAP
jgi:hypothetical protein